MKQIIIDCSAIETPRQFHEALAAAMALPEWYGHNLDAMYDCMTELSQPVTLVLSGWAALGERLGDYAGRLIFVLHRASEDNPCLAVELQS